MPAWTFLLRVVLCMALVLNGAAPASAAVVEPGAMTAPGGHASSCHGHAPMPAAGQHLHQPADRGSHPMGQQGCCKSGGCDCACVGALQVPPGLRPPLDAARQGPATGPGPRVAAVPAALPIRPPIS